MNDLIRSLETVVVGDGDLRGQAFQMLGYQKRFVRGAFKPGIIRGWAIPCARRW